MRSLAQNNLITNLLASGDPLAEVQHEAEAALEFARRARFGFVVDFITHTTPVHPDAPRSDAGVRLFQRRRVRRGSVRAASGRGPEPRARPLLYWVRKLQARFFAERLRARARGGGKGRTAFLDVAEIFRVRGAPFLRRVGAGRALRQAIRRGAVPHLEALAAHHRQLQKWAENCPENFENRAALVGAEIARIEGRDAMRCVSTNWPFARPAQTASSTTRRSPTNWPRASTRRAVSRRFAHVYLRKARDGYLRWGADGKVRQLDEMYPHLQDGTAHARPHEHDRDAGRTPRPRDRDQGVAGRLGRDRSRKTDRHAHAHGDRAGWRRARRAGSVVRERGSGSRRKPTTSGDAVIVELRDDPLTRSRLPESVLHYVIAHQRECYSRRRRGQAAFAEDPYIREHQARSILCLPLVSQAKLTGVLYLENNLARSVFAPARTAVLKLLASQAAISLKNTQLYRDLAEREARVVERTAELRRSEAYLAEAERLSHTGGWAVNLKGERTIVYWSEESYRIYGLDPLQGLPTRDGVWQQVHPDDRSRLYEEIQEAVREKRDYAVEFRNLVVRWNNQAPGGSRSSPVLRGRGASRGNGNARRCDGTQARRGSHSGKPRQAAPNRRNSTRPPLVERARRRADPYQSAHVGLQRHAV